VAWLRSQAAYPVCYFSAGSFENWRPDAGQFVAADKGKAMGDWPGEWWLDIRSANVKMIMAKVRRRASKARAGARGWVALRLP
jgi:hypothetical protein